jgi:hypothetical protein
MTYLNHPDMLPSDVLGEYDPEPEDFRARLAAELAWLRNEAVASVWDAEGEGAAKDLGVDLDRAIAKRLAALK